MSHLTTHNLKKCRLMNNQLQSVYCLVACSTEKQMAFSTVSVSVFLYCYAHFCACFCLENLQQQYIYILTNIKNLVSLSPSFMSEPHGVCVCVCVQLRENQSLKMIPLLWRRELLYQESCAQFCQDIVSHTQETIQLSEGLIHQPLLLHVAHQGGVIQTFFRFLKTGTMLPMRYILL